MTRMVLSGISIALTLVAATVHAGSLKIVGSFDPSPELAGKTIRFDESGLDQRRNALPDRVNRYVVYFDQNGTGQLWILGQGRLLPIRWTYDGSIFEVRETGSSLPRRDKTTRLCLKGFLVRRTLCRDDAQLDVSIRQKAAGDIFDLQSGQVPCRLCTANDDFETIRKITDNL